MKPWLSALLAGTLFGVGLCISGMTDPKNILAFLDVSGDFSPRLAGVMVGAIVVHASFLRIAARRNPAQAALSHASLPARAPIDGALIIGAALFGIGWGLSGYCPGPAIVALATAAPSTVLFVLSMIVGMLFAEALRRLALERRGRSSAS